MDDWEEDDEAFAFLQTTAKAASLERVESVQRLLQQHAVSIHEQLRTLRERLGASRALSESLGQSLTDATHAIELLLSRSQRSRVSVLVTGTPNAGKSVLVNAMAGTLVSPIASAAATAGLLTITTSGSTRTGATVYRLDIDRSDDSNDAPLTAERELLLESRSSARVYRTLELLYEEMRSDPNGADRGESKLVLFVPPSLSAFAQGPVTMELVDSPGVNNALPFMSDLWLAALPGSDVLVVVLALDQLETQDTVQLLRRLNAELPSPIAVKSLLVFLNTCDALLTSAELALAREQCQRAILTHTNGSLNVPTERIFVGCARTALVAQLATRLDPTMSVDAFSNEHAELATLAQQSAGDEWQQRSAPESVSELRAMCDWESALETNGFLAFQRALHAKTRAAAVTHVFKLLATVDGVAKHVRDTCERNVTRLRELLASDGTDVPRDGSALARLRQAQQTIQEYLDDVVQAREAALRASFQRELAIFLEDCRASVLDATSSALHSLPTVFSADDSHQLAETLNVFFDAAHEALAQPCARYLDDFRAMLRRRRQLVVSSHSDIQEALVSLGIALPGIVDEDEDEDEQSSLPDEFLNRLGEWLLRAIDPLPAQLLREVQSVVRLDVDPGTDFTASYDFRTGSASACVESVEGHIEGDGHAVLVGVDHTMLLSFVVDLEFVGLQLFTLELEHLTSDIGDASRAPVTVRVNGNIIREAFCPRAMHERNGDKHGLWSFAKDRWHVHGAYVHSGLNTVSITYDSGGTSHYWLRSLALTGELEPTTHAALYTRDVKTVVDAAIARRLCLSDEHMRLVDDVLGETSHALRDTFNTYVAALKRLVRSRVQAESAIDAYTSALDGCDAVVEQCAELLERMAQLQGDVD